jgi:hypothetical protein
MLTDIYAVFSHHLHRFRVQTVRSTPALNTSAFVPAKRCKYPWAIWLRLDRVAVAIARAEY